MINRPALRELFAPESFCLEPLVDSKVADALLMISAIAMIIIGSLAVSGVFTTMSHAHAMYLSYGMFVGAGVCLFVEVVKVIFKCLRDYYLLSGPLKPEQLDLKMKKIKKVVIGKNVSKINPPIYEVTVVLKNGRKIDAILNTVEIRILEDAIKGKESCFPEFLPGRSKNLKEILVQIFKC